MIKEQDASTRDRRIWNGILSGLAGRGLGLIAPFLVMPAMLSHLGPVNFGVWMTAVSITSMAMFIDFGIGNGLLTKLSKAYGERDFLAMRQLIATGYATLILISVVGVCTLGLLLLGATQGAPNFWNDTNKDSKSIIAITGASFLLSIPASAIQRIMLANQNNVCINAWQVASSIVAIGSCYGAIYLNQPASAAVAAYSIPPIGIMLLAAALYFKKNPQLRPKPSHISRKNAKELIALGSYFFILSTLTSISLNSDNLIIAYTLGAETVTEYAAPAKLASALALLVTTISLPLWAANGDAIARKDYEWIQKNIQRMSIFGGSVILASGILLVFFGEKIMTLWMGRNFHNTTQILASFSLLYFLLSITSPYQMLLNGAGIIKVQIAAWTAYLLISTGMKILTLIATEEIWAVPLISAITFFVCVLPPIAISAKKLHQDLRKTQHLLMQKIG